MMPNKTGEKKTTTKQQTKIIPQQLVLRWGMRDLNKSIFMKKSKGIFRVQKNKVEKISKREVMQMTQCGHGLLSNGHRIFRKCILCPLQLVVGFFN